MRLALWTVAFLGACAHPDFVLPRAPQPIGLPQNLVAPVPYRVAPTTDFPVLVDAVRSRLATPAGRITILPVHSPGGSPAPASVPISGALGDLVGDDAAAAMGDLLLASLWRPTTPQSEVGHAIERHVVRALVAGGRSDVVGPDGLRDIGAEKKAQRDGTVTWRAPLADLVQVEPLLGGGTLLALRLDRVATEVVNLTATFALHDNAMRAYAARYSEIEPALRSALTEARAERARYAAALDAADKAFVGDRGRYDHPRRPEPAELRADGEATLAEMDAAIARLQRAVSDAVSPAELADTTAARREDVTVEVVHIDLHARLLNASDLSILWLGDLSSQHTEGEKAVEQLVDRLVLETFPQAPPSPTP